MVDDTSTDIIRTLTTNIPCLWPKIESKMYSKCVTSDSNLGRTTYRYSRGDENFEERQAD